MRSADAVECWVLLVEPEGQRRLTHRDGLLAEGYRVDEASDVDSALELARLRAYSLVISSLPLGNGQGLARLEQLAQLQGAARYLLLGKAPLALPPMGYVEGKLAGALLESATVSELLEAVQRALCTRRRDTWLPIEGRAARILVVEADDGAAARLSELLAPGADHLELCFCKRLDDAVGLLAPAAFDAVLTDLTLPDARGLDAVTQLQRAAAGVPIVVVADIAEHDFAAQALEHGAQDYLTKQGLDGRQLWKSLRQAMERKQLENQLMLVAHYDPLSGLANRVLFHDRLAHALARSRREGREFAVLFVDLDRFKVINDTLGHEAGDALLHELGSRLRAAVRESDTVARLGGDEFALLLETTSAPIETSKAAARMIDSIGQPFPYRGTELVVTASVGIATYPQDGETVESLLAAADAAMYTAKGQGRNTYRHYRANLRRGTENERLMDALRRGLERQEFVVHFQPQIDLRTQGAVAVEAFMRWRRKDGMLMMPSAFMSTLEQSGLIVDVGRFILDAACAQLHAWAEQGRALRLAVNVSACELRQRDFIANVARTLQRWHLQGPELELELPETQLAVDNEHTTRSLRRLRDLGIRLAIDDFGTGFVPLDYLRRVAVDTVKIDGSFVRNIPDDSKSMAITSAVIRLGERLGIAVIAEGVETNTQLEVLAREGCGLAQGYVCAPPMPPDRVWDDFDPQTLQWHSRPPEPEDGLGNQA